MSEAAPVAPATPAPAAPLAPPVAAPPAPVAKAPEPPVAQNSAALAALAKEQVRLNQQRQALAAQAKEMEAAKSEAKEMARLRSLAKENPAAFIKEFGVDYGALTKAQIESNKDGTAKRQDLDALRAEFNEKLAAEKKALDDARRKEMSAREYQRFHGEVSSLVKSVEADEKYEVLMATWKPLTRAENLESVLIDYIRYDLESQVASGAPNPKPMTKEEALERANADAIARYEEMPSREKLKRYAPKQAEPEVVKPKETPAEGAAAKKPDAAEAKDAKAVTDAPKPPDPSEFSDFADYQKAMSAYQRSLIARKKA